MQAAGAYRLGELGWLQFQELCAAVVEADTGVPETRWSGAADQGGRHVVLPGRALASVVWLRESVPPERRRPALLSLLSGVRERLILERFASATVMTNAAELFDAEMLDGMLADRVERVAVHGHDELSQRLDASAALRRRMPAALGTTSLERLIPPEAAATRASTLDRAAAEQLAPVFVATQPYRRALASLEQNGFVVLTGPPEVGKTAIATMLALVQLTDGWEAHDCRHPDELFGRYRRESRQIFLADDAFGSTEYRPDAAERWARELDRVLARMDATHWLVWTSRPAPLAAGLRRVHRERGLERFPDPGSVQIDASRLTEEEKALILFRHVRATAPDRHRRRYVQAAGDRLVGDRYFTPERIRRFAVALHSPIEAVLEASVEAALHDPTAAMKSSFDALEEEHRDLLVALLDAPPTWVPERELTRALRRHHPGGLAHAPHELIDRLADHFLRVSDGGIGWVHPSWRDLVIETLAADPERRATFLRVAGIDGVELAISVAGGAAGERNLPLMAGDGDWDVLTTRVLELVRDEALGSEDAARLLHALAEASLHEPGGWSSHEAVVLTRAVLEETRARLEASDLALPLLEAWLEAAAAAAPAPELPSLARAWATLVPVARFAGNPAEVARADDWLRLAEVLRRHRPSDLARLGFPLQYADVVAALVSAGRADPWDPALARVLLRLSRLMPETPGLWELTMDPDLPEREEPSWTPATPGGFSVASVLLDL
jgi:hypothetical protein